jgi:hypothetical protein
MMTFSINEQKGTALVGVMMILLVLTLLGTSAFLTSTTELKISANYHQNLRALYAAEAGVQQLLAGYRRNPDFFWQKKTGPEMNFPMTESDSSCSPGIKFWIQELRYDPQEVPAFVEVIMVGKDSENYGLSRVRATIYGLRSGGPNAVPQIFREGIVTAGQLQLSGTLEILGNVHANQGYRIEPASAIDQIHQNLFKVTQSLDPTRSDYVPPVDIPEITEQRFQDYHTLAQQSGNQLFLGNQNLRLTGDQKNLLIFIDGDLTLEGNNLSGATIVASGSITLNGSTILADNHTLNVALIAGQDIILNNFSQVAGVLWSNRTVQKSGNGRLMGSIVCRGPILQAGELQFERVSQISNVFLSPSAITSTFVLNGWSQI